VRFSCFMRASLQLLWWCGWWWGGCFMGVAMAALKKGDIQVRTGIRTILHLCAFAPTAARSAKAAVHKTAGRRTRHTLRRGLLRCADARAPASTTTTHLASSAPGPPAHQKATMMPASTLIATPTGPSGNFCLAIASSRCCFRLEVGVSFHTTSERASCRLWVARQDRTRNRPDLSC